MCYPGYIKTGGTRRIFPPLTVFKIKIERGNKLNTYCGLKCNAPKFPQVWKVSESIAWQIWEWETRINTPHFLSVMATGLARALLFAQRHGRMHHFNTLNGPLSVYQVLYRHASTALHLKDVILCHRHIGLPQFFFNLFRHFTLCPIFRSRGSCFPTGATWLKRVKPWWCWVLSLLEMSEGKNLAASFQYNSMEAVYETLACSEQCCCALLPSNGIYYNT